ncbi:tyrosine-type recombinase/integrase, partial [Marinimicrococcus flavescens]|nr:tyrosine-type recombinase/integrase [Marinimicrococcus flavescens]
LAAENRRNLISQYQEISTFCGDRGIAIPDLSVGVAREYMVWLAERPNYNNGKPLSTATRAKHYICLRRLSMFLIERGLLGSSLIEGIRRPVRRRTMVQGFSVQQLQALIIEVRNVRTNPRYKDRMSLLVYLLASTGLRINEALQLRVNSFDHNKRTLLVIGKGDKEREVPFSYDL